jgi:hypothetical protein
MASIASDLRIRLSFTVMGNCPHATHRFIVDDEQGAQHRLHTGLFEVAHFVKISNLCN